VSQPGHGPEAERLCQAAQDALGELAGLVFIACGFDAAGGMEGQARRLAEGIAARGVPVTYVTSSPSTARRPVREERGLLSIYRVPVLAAVDWATTLGILEVTALQVVGRRRGELSAIYAVQHETGAIAARVGEATGLPVMLKFACGGSLGDAYTVLHHRDRDALLQALRRVDRLAAITDGISREARDLLGIDPQRIVRVQNGIDLRRWTFREPSPPTDQPLILYVGRMSVQKRVGLVLRAVADLREAFPGIRLQLAGRGPLEAGLKTQADRLGLRDRATFLGVRDDVPELLRQADVLVLPSLVEGTPNSVLEAMATGTPVVATRVQGTDELVRHDQDGLLVPPGDPAALGTAIGRVLSEPELGARLARSARARVEARYDMERVIDQHLALFGELAADREKAGPAKPAPRRRNTTRMLKATTYAGLRAGRDAVRSTAQIVAGKVGPRGEVFAPGLRRGVVILVRDIDALGGMERQAINLAKGLVTQGVKVTIITCTSPGLLTLPREGWAETRYGARLYRVPLLLYESAAASILYRHRDDWGVIYAVQLMMGAIGARLGRLFDAPVVVKLACSGPWGDMAALRGLEDQDREQVTEDLSRCHLVCVGGEIRDEALEAGFAPDRLLSIPNGVEVDAVETAPVVRPFGDDPTILFAGRLTPQKGLDLLLHAFTHVGRKVPFVRLLLAGTGPMRKELETIAQRDGMADRVHFLGRRDDVWGLLRGATICAMPSRSEGLSNFLLEAMASATPVVATKIRPNHEALGDGNALLVPADDVQAFAHAMIELLENPALRSQLATAGRARVRSVYAMERVVSAYVDLFDSLPPGANRPNSPIRFAGRFLGARGDDVRRVLRRLGAGL
jgi:glycosyltransferase involved in cell wall biosynthesis